MSEERNAKTMKMIWILALLVAMSVLQLAAAARADAAPHLKKDAIAFTRF
jgi:hypothetical protein